MKKVVITETVETIGWRKANLEAPAKVLEHARKLGDDAIASIVGVVTNREGHKTWVVVSYEHETPTISYRQPMDEEIPGPKGQDTVKASGAGSDQPTSPPA